ncbi:MAG TPA: hypothetical protein VIY86_05355, partial [Pirellulaceae bacterium]
MGFVSIRHDAIRRRLLALSVCLGVGVFAARDARGTESGETFQPKHVARLKSVVEARISPDGQRIAYGLAVQRQPLADDDGPAWIELHVVDLSGSSRPFVTGKVTVS